MKFILSLILSFILIGCALKTEITNIDPKSSYSALKEYETFFFLEQDTITSRDTTYIGQIRTNNTGLAANCTYEKAKALIIDEARKLGGNCFVLTQHKKPNGLNSMCHILKGRVLRLKHPELYETEIVWHSKRKLEIQNFKGSIENRPFQAATYSYPRYELLNANRMKGTYDLLIESIFNCDLSYFKPSFKTDVVLSHEQLHFDITELYTRKFRKLVKEKNWTYDQFMASHEAEAKKIWIELSRYQDLYDSEVYADHTLQNSWTERVRKELMELDLYKDVNITIQYK